MKLRSLVKTFLLSASLALFPALSQAQTWLSSPGSSVWNTGTNWDTSIVPNTASDTATFGTSSATSLNLTASITLGGMRFNSGASSYLIDAGGFNVDLSGAGIVNASSAAQTLFNSGNGLMRFANSSSTDDITLINTGALYFNDTSTADSASITNSGSMAFLDSSTAANSTINSNGYLSFLNSSTAANAVINGLNYTTFNHTTTAASATITNNNNLVFYNSSTASAATILNSANLYFYDTTTAGNSNIANNSLLNFENNATAGAATITTSNGSQTRFLNTSTGGTARLILNAGGELVVDGHSGPLTLGSLEGAGSAYIGTTSLAVGTNNLSTTLSGAIDDGAFTGSFTKVGSGFLTLSGLNTYDGGTTVAAGVLVLDTSGRLGTGAVQNSATLLFINSAASDGLTLVNGSTGTIGFQNTSTAGNAVISNAVTGNMYFDSNATADNATIQNNGTLTFSNNATADNAAITNAGSLFFLNNSTLNGSTITTNSGGNTSLLNTSTGGSSRIIVNSGGTFDIGSHTGSVTVGSIEGAGSFTLGANNLFTGITNMSTTLSGVLSGTGGALSKLGTGTLTLTGVNTHTGGTFATGGLAINSDSALGSGNLALNAGTLRTLAGITSSRSVSIGLGNGTFDSNGFDSTMNGIISGPGRLTKTGAGTLILGAANTHSGGTTLSAGTLAVGNSLSLGSGTVVVNAGTLATNGGPLAVNVGGDYIQNSGGSLSLGVSGTLAGQWDNLNVVGVAALGGTLNITSYGGFQPVGGDTLIMLSAGNGVSGRFDQWTSPVGIRWYLIYQPYSVLLQAIHPSFQALGLTPNQKAVGAWLDSVYQDSKLQTLLLNIGTQPAATLPPDYDLIAPEDLTPLYRMGYAAAQSRSLLVERRLAEVRDIEGSGSRTSRFRPWGQESPLFAAALPGDELLSMARNAGTQDRWGVFISGAGNFANVTGDGNGAGYRFTATGMTAGLDYRIERNLTAGLLLGYSQGGATNASGGKVDVTGGMAGLYGGVNLGGFHTEALVEAGLNSYKTTRPGFGGAATGAPSGTQLSGTLSTGYNFKMGLLKWGPFVGGQYTLVQLNAFAEQGSQAPLSFASQSQGSLRGEAGLQFSPSFGGKDLTLTPRISAAYERYFEGTQDSLTAGLTGAAGTFKTLGPLTGDGAVAVGLGVDAEFASGLSAFVQYQGKFALTNYDSQGFSGGVNVGF